VCKKKPLATRLEIALMVCVLSAPLQVVALQAAASAPAEARQQDKQPEQGPTAARRGPPTTPPVSAFKPGPLDAGLGAQIRTIVLAQLKGTVKAKGPYVATVRKGTKLDVTLEGHRYQGAAYRHFVVSVPKGGNPVVRRFYVKTTSPWKLREDVVVPPETYLAHEKNQYKVVDVPALAAKARTEQATATKAIAESNQAIAQNNWARAKKLIDDALAKHPQSKQLAARAKKIAREMELQRLLAAAQRAVDGRNWEGALEHVWQALRVRPKDERTRGILETIRRALRVSKGHYACVAGMSMDGNRLSVSILWMTGVSGKASTSALLVAGFGMLPTELEALVEQIRRFIKIQGMNNLRISAPGGRSVAFCWGVVRATSNPTRATLQIPSNLSIDELTCVQLFKKRGGKLVPVSNCLGKIPHPGRLRRR